MSLPFSHPKRIVLLALTALATACLLFGLTLPMLTLSKFWLINHSVSLLGGLAALWAQGQWWLAILIGLFSVVLPIAKLGLLFRVLLSATDHSAQYWLGKTHAVGKWAMLDVWVVAVLIVSVKLGALASVTIHSGVYFFAAAVLLTMLTTHHLISHTRAQGV